MQSSGIIHICRDTKLRYNRIQVTSLSFTNMHNLLLTYCTGIQLNFFETEVLENGTLTGCGGWLGQETFPVPGPEAGSGPEGDPEKKSACVPT